MRALLLDSTSFVQGVPSSGNILGATAGSTISGSGLPTGFSINSAAATWSYDGSAGASGTMFLTEVLGGLQNATAIDYTVSAGVPANVNLPTINGTDQEGVQLFCDVGNATVDWTNNPTSFAYQWQLNNANVGTNSAFYTPPLGSRNETGTCIVTPSNGAGAGAPVTAGPTGTILAAIAPNNVTAATIAGLNPPQVGSALTAIGGSANGDPASTRTRQWKRGTTVIGNGASYTPVTADLGSAITYLDTWTNIAGSISAGVATAAVVAGTPGIDLTMPMPTITVTSPNTAYPPTVNILGPIQAKVGTHTIELQASSNDDTFAAPVLDDTLNPTDANTGGTTILDTNMTGFTSGIKLFRARLRWTSGGNAMASQWCPIVGHGDTTAVTISTATTQNPNEKSTMNIALTGNKPLAAVAITGQDMAKIQIAGDPVNGWSFQWFANGTQTYNSTAGSGPAADGTNNFKVNVQVWDFFGNTTTLPFTFQLQAVVLSPNAFSFGTVTGAPTNTLETSSTITVSGMTAGFAVNASVTGPTGTQYSKNGGAWTNAGSFQMQNGDTLAVRQTSSSSQLTETDVVVTIADKTATYAVVTSGTFNPATLFGSSDNGFVLDATDLTTLFQQIGSSTPCTVANGTQVVGTWTDKSGKGNTFAALANDSTRPTLTSNGVQFDGVNDQLIAALACLYAGAKAGTGMTIVMDVTAPVNSSGSAQPLIIEGSSTSPNPKYEPFASGSAVDTYRFFVRDDLNSSKATAGSTIVKPIDGAAHTIVITDNGTGLQLTSDGATDTIVNYTHTTLTMDHTALGGYAGTLIQGTSAHGAMTVRRIIAINRLLNSTELGNSKAWVVS